MTTLSLKLHLPDHTARELERMARLSGRTESEFLSEAVVHL
ncbi:MAG: ribbon-helix-helix protein, CopG family, partial [Rhodothermales bacterium]